MFQHLAEPPYCTGGCICDPSGRPFFADHYLEADHPQTNDTGWPTTLQIYLINALDAQGEGIECARISEFFVVYPRRSIVLQ